MGGRVVNIDRERQGLHPNGAIARLAFGGWQPAGYRAHVQQGLKAAPLAGLATLHNDVPPEIRRRREELGFDYGKFDYVVTGSGAKLLDANRTQWMAYTVEEPRMAAMASGLADFLPWSALRVRSVLRVLHGLVTDRGPIVGRESDAMHGNAPRALQDRFGAGLAAFLD